MPLKIKYSGRVWLNGEFGVSRVRETPFILGGENDYHDPKKREVMKSLIADFGIQAMLEWVMNGGVGGTPLGSSKVVKSHRTRKARGTKGLSRWGGRILRNSIHLLEREAGKDSLSFLTLTVPDCSLSDYRGLAASWDEVTRQLIQHLRRRLQSQQLSGEVVGVSEIQEKRYQRTGVPALHLHLLFQGRAGRKTAWVITPKWVRKAWMRIIKPYLPSATAWNSLENLQRIQKSAGAYMAKYMSKGVHTIERMIDEGLADCVPKAWWNCSFSLRRRVLSLSPCGFSVGEVVVNIINSGDWSSLSYLFPIRLEHPLVGAYTVGYAGKFLNACLNDVLEHIRLHKLETRQQNPLLTCLL